MLGLGARSKEACRLHTRRARPPARGSLLPQLSRLSSSAVGTWRLLEHTADLALEGRGDDPEEALEALCLGLMKQITDTGAVRAAHKVPIRAEGMDRAETLVSALGELLYRVNVRGWVFCGFAADEVGDNRIRITARGELRDPKRHPVDLEIKAATYHDLRFEPDSSQGGWVVRVIFDV